MNKKNLIILLVVFAILLIVGAFFLINLMRGSVYERVSAPTSAPAEVYESPSQIAPTASPEVEAESTAAPVMDEALIAEMDKIESQVSKLRGLNTDQRIPRKLMSSAELRETVKKEFLEEYSTEDELKETKTLNLFGLLPKDFALRDFYLDLYSEQIAGFYDTDEKFMYVISDSGFGGAESSTYAHEFTHVLQDANFDFKGKLHYSDEFCEEDSERCIAVLSLIEGDATLAQTLWLQTYATKKDLQELKIFFNSIKTPVLDNAPAYMREDFTFPYLYGAEFVQNLFAQGGYELINHAFQEQPPVSSEQILHPEVYPDELPDIPTLPDLQKSLSADWELVDEDVIGEWYTYLILAKGYNSRIRLQESIALDAAEGWGGDRYAVLKNNTTGEYAVIYRSNWDSAEDAEAAFTAFGKYSDLRFGSLNSDGYREGDGYFSSLSQIDDTSFFWIVAESSASLTMLQNVMGE